MISTNYREHSNMLIIEVNGQFTQERFNDIFIAEMNNILKSFPEVNIVLNFNEELTGWKLLSLLSQFKQYIAPYNGINRLAIMSDNSLLKWRLNLCKLRTSPSIENFACKDIEKAKAWLAIG